MTYGMALAEDGGTAGLRTPKMPFPGTFFSPQKISELLFLKEVYIDGPCEKKYKFRTKGG